MAFGAKLRENIEAASEAGDADTEDLFTEVSRVIDKDAWFIGAHNDQPADGLSRNRTACPLGEPTARRRAGTSDMCRHSTSSRPASSRPFCSGSVRPALRA